MTSLPPIGDLLPHGPEMTLIDEVVSLAEGSFVAAVLIAEDRPFAVQGHGMPAHVGIEYMAQACGAYVGALAHGAGQPVQIGYLLGTRNFHAAKPWFAFGTRLHVHVVEILREDGMGVFDCKIMEGDETVATAQLNVHQPKDIRVEEKR